MPYWFHNIRYPGTHQFSVNSLHQQIILLFAIIPHSLLSYRINFLSHVASRGRKFQFWRASGSLHGLHKLNDLVHMVWSNEWKNMQLSNQWLTEEMTRSFQQLRREITVGIPRYGVWNLKIEDILDKSISPDEQLSAALESGKQKRRQALLLPCKELQFNERGTERTSHDKKQKRSLTFERSSISQILELELSKLTKPKD